MTWELAVLAVVLFLSPIVIALVMEERQKDKPK